MQEGFHAEIRRSFEAADKHRNVVAEIRKHARETPELLAMRIAEVVPRCLEEKQQIAAKAFGLDLADAQAIRAFEAKSVVEWQLVCWLASYYQVYSACLRLIKRYVEDANLTGTPFAQAVCEAFLEATERFLYTVVEDFDTLRTSLPRQDFPSEELAKLLAGIAATRISLERNRRLRAAIDELREHSRQKTAQKERLEQLLNELVQEVLPVWDGIQHYPSSLNEVRTEAARRLEKPHGLQVHDKELPALETELATFAERERLLRRGRDVGLPPKEYKLFRYLVANPKATNAEAARELGVAVGTVKSLKARIKKTLEAA